jgi:hypothetical protein
VALAISQEAVQHFPWPFIGIDEDGMIATANVSAERLFAGDEPLLGSSASSRLPQHVLSWCAANDGDSLLLEVNGERFALSRQALGVGSLARGTMLVLRPAA